jgi:hypothetical protein
MSLCLSDKEQREQMAKTGYNKLAISFGEAKVGLMEAYNLSSGASITMVHAEGELKGTSVVGGPVQDFPPFVFFLAGTIFFEASPNQNKNRQTSNKERDNF